MPSNKNVAPDGGRDQPGLPARIYRRLIGAPRDLGDHSIFHKMALIPFLAWIGLGADGLSSSAYGPEEAFRALQGHYYLAILLAPAMALTVFIISYAYSRIIEHFPQGGGGYIVATHMLGNKAGVISGCALLVDYILTITVSIVSCTDALFSFLPLEYQAYKIECSFVLILVLIVLNLRGIKESISILAPIFMLFIATHAVLLGYGIFSHTAAIPEFAAEFSGNWTMDLPKIGGLGVFLLLIHSYSLGGGTYTGIEAVSNGLQIMREPRVQTGKRTMVYMATSLALTAAGLFICYELWKTVPTEGKTLNTVLAEMVFGAWPMGSTLALVTILSEGALLLVAAQAGFLDGPRVMANMATDYWLPTRFASLSDRLTSQNGVVLMGVSAILLLFYTGGSISALIVMYSINVFLTFSLSEFGMSRFFIRHRKEEKKWLQHLSVHATGFILCATILVITLIEKFSEGGWITLLITGLTVILCFVIKGHYNKVKDQLENFNNTLMQLNFPGPANDAVLDPQARTAVQLVTGFNGFGIHTLMSIIRNFPGHYKNVVFVSVAVVDSSSFKGARAIDALKDSVKTSLEKYVELARKLGLAADYRTAVGTEVVTSAVDLCAVVAREYPQSVVFSGQLTFCLDKFYHRILHNQTAYAIQRRLQQRGVTTVILPIQVEM
ncbi:MAG: APC family permease [Desulfovibrionaceae bacterium]|nr:APC family permease [Desulfovibrionaceae bacterium]MBF0513783.1 APC family permease [Desulfovibrionaceae bacterium]